MTSRALHIFFFLLLLAGSAGAQDVLRGIGNRIPRGGGGGTGDTLERRNNAADSITLFIYSLDSVGGRRPDTSIGDYTVRFPVPATHLYLGNLGSPTRSLLFEPRMQAGFDQGQHAYDVYRWRAENARFYNTTRPLTELGYLLGSQTQQMIEVFHTQNIRPYWNAAFNYRLTTSPGFFKNQKTNHNNVQLTSWYQSPNKRYNNYLVLTSNKLQAGENGGIVDTLSAVPILDDPEFTDRFAVPVRLGNDIPFGRDFFTSRIAVGNRYRISDNLLRQQYDFGRKDSIVTDSTVIPLFYPRLRLEHTLRYSSSDYHYFDHLSSSPSHQLINDTATYFSFYGLDTNEFRLQQWDTLELRDQWTMVQNDFSIYQFPDARNLRQYIKAGISYQWLRGRLFQGAAHTFYNIQAQGEYRNRTRNGKWDINAYGRLFLNGYNAGDYHAYISLQRLLSARLGSLQLGFENSARQPSFIYDQRSSYYLDEAREFGKQNTTHLFGRIVNDPLRLVLGADYYLISNYLYQRDFFRLRQESGVFNVLRAYGLKTFRLSRRWNLHAEVYLQQKAGAAEVNLPLLYTRNRLAYEGTFFRNLNLSTGLEVRYHSPFRADGYFPVNGQFYYQDSVTISNLPELHAFMHFRIRTFRAYARVENLQTFRQLGNGFGFTNNSLAAPGYPLPGMVIRFGIYWSFVN